MKLYIKKIYLFSLFLLFSLLFFAHTDCYAIESRPDIEVDTIEDLYRGISKQIYNQYEDTVYNINSYDIFYRLPEILNHYDYYYCEEEPIMSGSYLCNYVDEFWYTTIERRSLKGFGYRVEISLKYKYSGTDMREYFNNMQETANELKKDSDYESIKAVHDYILKEVDYDYDYNNYLDIEGFKTGKMVCNGYSMAMFLLLNDMDIPVRIIWGTTSDSPSNVVDHAWNIVCIDGNWYNIDCTWDDANGRFHSYAYFLKGSNDFSEHIYDDNMSTEKAMVSTTSYTLPFFDSLFCKTLELIANPIIIFSILAIVVAVISIVQRARREKIEEDV